MRRRLLTGGTVWAGAACTPLAGWVLVEDDRIAAVGEASERGAALPSPVDERLDLSGCHVLPGFVDVHLHLSQAAWFLLGVDGLDWTSVADCLHAVRVQAAGAAAPEAIAASQGTLRVTTTNSWRSSAAASAGEALVQGRSMRPVRSPESCLIALRAGFAGGLGCGSIQGGC